jgi:hypothetical protein
MYNKVVARYKDGRIVRGTTVDFNPSRDAFHVMDSSSPGSMPVLVQTRQLKALFFVKDLAGDPDRVGDASPSSPRPALGRRIKIVFTDGEVLTGRTAAYQPGRSGFFVEPEDPGTNEERCYVLVDATQDITFL